jgi:hypothetical protein
MGRRALIGAGTLGLMLLLSQSPATPAAEVKVIGSSGVASVVGELAREFEARTGHKVQTDFAVVAVSKRKIDAGAAASAQREHGHTGENANAEWQQSKAAHLFGFSLDRSREASHALAFGRVPQELVRGETVVALHRNLPTMTGSVRQMNQNRAK